MTESVEHLILEHLRALRGDLSIVKTDVVDVKIRLGRLVEHVSHVAGDVRRHYARHDALERRVERIERRLELRD